MANDFSRDASFIAYYPNDSADFSGGLILDRINTYHCTNLGSVTADTTNKEVGTASALFNGSADRMTRADATSAAFPFANSGSVRQGTFLMWCRSVDLSVLNVLQAKGRDSSGGTSDQCIVFFVNAVTGLGTLSIGYNNGASGENWNLASGGLTANQWYHIAFSFDDADKSGHVRIYDKTGDSVTDHTHTFTNNINVSDAAAYDWGWFTGNVVPWLGQIDDIQVVDKVLSNDEIDAVRSGTFGAAVPGGAMFLGANM